MKIEKSRRFSLQARGEEPEESQQPKADHAGGTLLEPGKNEEEESSIVKSRWSRLDYFVHKPTKLEELTDVARMLLIAKREEEMKAALRVPSKTCDVE